MATLQNLGTSYEKEKIEQGGVVHGGRVPGVMPSHHDVRMHVSQKCPCFLYKRYLCCDVGSVYEEIS